MKNRLDLYLSQKRNITRSRAQTLIKEGRVRVSGIIVNKPAFEVGDAEVTVEMGQMYVSRGAYKLLGAKDAFALDFEGRIVLDMGASTGGFTQVLIEGGAKKVYAVDVGHGELDKALTRDARVINLEGRDIRSLTKEELSGVDLVVGDLSFISLKRSRICA